MPSFNDIIFIVFLKKQRKGYPADDYPLLRKCNYIDAVSSNSVENFKANIALIPKPTATEKTLGIIIIAVMFIPFAFGIFTANKWLLLSLPAGFLLGFIFNLFSKGKFNHKNWIQKDFFVEFTLNGINISSSTTQKEFLWSEMEGTQLYVEGFDGEVKADKEESGNYSGTENKLVFNAHNVTYEFNFYIENAERKAALKSFLKNETLNAVNTHLTFKDKRGVYSEAINSFKDVPEEPEPQSWKKSKKSIGCLVLFATPFVLIGLGTFGLSLYQFGKVIQAEEWLPVRARILTVDMAYSSDSDATKVKAQYEYNVGSKTFRGSTVSFNAGMNNIENYGELYHTLNQSKAIQIYVNENDPAESVIIRGVTNAMIGVLIFSVMWNTLLLAFALPMLSKKITVRSMLFITVVVWILGIGKLVSGIGNIDIAQQVFVIEAKEEQE